MKKILTILFFSFIAYSIFGQDTIYYDNDWNKTESLKIAAFYKTVQKNANTKNEFTERAYFKSGQIKYEIFYFIDNNEKKKRLGKSSFWYESGELKNEMNYENGEKNGEFLSYWKNGKLKRKDYFNKGKFKNGECWNENGEKVKHYDFEIQASYPGGQDKMYEFIKKNLKYPPLSKQYNLGGKVVVDFKINTDGSVYDLNIAEGVNSELDSEAVRIIKSMPKWRPAYQDGIAVSIKYRIPIIFKQ